jgi:hypothetical protein
MYNKKNECPVCGKKIVYAKIVKEGNKTTHRAYHEGEVPEGAEVLASITNISPTYRKRLRDAIQHTGIKTIPVFDATGMNRIVMVTEVINIMKENGMSDEDATAMRKNMLAKGSNYEVDIELAKPYVTIMRN